ncbi:hypothetical protein CSA56_09445 [candidate division KSB3 bacterium]|uniref:Uncharacterized protein n=1 Tax=candidate division KSB3 bacterium TaxID=2044937 RepID=A0A2G6KDZ8_9BACT|nr:MAG: hypothetical protein CSA56_09445 [candidate division KSB3 bacterium]
MALSDREYMRSPSSGYRRGIPASGGKNVIMILIAMNVAVFLLIPNTARLLRFNLTLSPQGVLNLKLWQFVTYMFLHANFSHLFFNMWGLYLFGSTILPVMGPKRFLQLYCLSGVSGAVLWFILNWNSPAGLVGASGAVFGVMMGAAMLNPHMRVQLLFPPIPMYMKTLILIYTAIEIVSEFSSSSGGIAHLAHMGGFISAYVFLKYLYGNRVWDPLSFLGGVFTRKKMPPRQKKPPQKASKVPDGWSVHSNPTYEAPPTNRGPVPKEEIDRLLDKISNFGMGSLTEEELAILKWASGEMKH